MATDRRQVSYQADLHKKSSAREMNVFPAKRVTQYGEIRGFKPLTTLLSTVARLSARPELGAEGRRSDAWLEILQNKA